MQRAYLQVLARGAKDTRKIILTATNSQNTVILLNLEEKLRSDLMELPVAGPKGKGSP